MKTIFLLLSFAVVSAMNLNAQDGTLKYSQALIITDTEQEVPADKVWKITSVYGIEGNACVHVCNISGGGPDCSSRPYTTAAATTFYVNSNRIYSYLRQISSTWYSSSTCTSGAGAYSVTAMSVQGTVVEPNPNIFPM